MRSRFFFVAGSLLSALLSFAQVNLQTGSAEFSLPMFNWQDNKSRLYSSVALRYSSGSGLRVSDIASNVGQGWNLLAGGVITRMQVGEPDDQISYGTDGEWVNGMRGEFDLSKIPPGYLNATIPSVNGCPDALRKYPIYKSMNQVYVQHNLVSEDRQLDYFYFQFNGKSGVFILDTIAPHNSNEYAGHLLGDSKIKITAQIADLKNDGIRTTITSFKIHDIDGLIYSFEKKGLTKVLKNEYCDENFKYLRVQPEFKDERVYFQTGFEDSRFVYPWVVGSWYLTEIKDPLTGREIIISYNDNPTAVNIAGQDVLFNDGDKKYITISQKKSITKTPDIAGITFPDGHTVSFSYGQARADVNGANALASIDFKYKGRHISRYSLRTTYFIRNKYGTPTDDQRSFARLCLRSVQKLGVDLKEESPPYYFDYYLGSDDADDFVPPPHFYAKDIWGYFNGDNSKGYYNEALDLTTSLTEVSRNSYHYNFFNRPIYENDGFNRAKGLCFLNNSISGVVLNAKPGRAKNGLLRQIIYPTGGTLSYEYEQNYGVLDGSLKATGGVHVSITRSADGGYSNSCENAISTSYSYVLPGGGSSLWGLEIPANSTHLQSHYAAEEKKFKPLKLACVYNYQYPGILSQQQAISLNTLQKVMEIAAPVLSAISIVTTVMDVVTVLGGGSPVSLIIDLIGIIAGAILTCTADMSEDTESTVYYSFDLNASAPLPAQFKRVEIIENPGTIGKTIHEFTSDDDYPLWVPAGQNPLFSAKQRFAPWAYGLPKKSTVFDNNGNTVKETENIYSWGSTKTMIENCGGHFGITCNDVGIASYIVSCNCIVKEASSERNPLWADPNHYTSEYKAASDNVMDVDFYGYYTGRTELVSSKEKIFSNSNPDRYVETKSDYMYNAENYEISSILTSQSNGDKILKQFIYNISRAEGVYDILKNNNITSLPVETTTQLIRDDVYYNAPYLHKTSTDFAQVANGDVRPMAVNETRFDEPGSDANAGTVTTTQYFYDGASNLVGVSDEGNRFITSIYGYDDKYVIASVVNANPVTDKTAYTSFEEDGFGNWVVVGNTATTTSSVTGQTSRLLMAGSSLQCSGLNTAKVYTLSFWASSSASVSSGQLVTSAPTINGFTYYEYNIPIGTGSVSISGDITIDEVRLYPSNARMRTVSYDPVIGKISEADENNRITYYEYDNLGRLELVRDENRNITKMYEYSSVSKQNGCPGIYFNHLITEFFRKNDCGAGSIGSTVTVTIAADTYSSTESQEDADIQAQNYLLANGQNIANSSGICLAVYYNTVQSGTYTTTNCEEGYKGGLVTYTVAAGSYSTTMNQFVADSLAMEEVIANGQAWANDPRYAICLIDTAADWTQVEPDSSYCQSVGGTLHLFVLSVDINPNSGTYSQTQFIDIGPSASCNLYYSQVQSGTFTKVCADGGIGSSVPYTVPAGTFTSTVSQEDADQQAANYLNINGQENANSEGTCTYTNDERSDVFRKQCSDGGMGSYVIYTVEAGKYSSTVSKEDANLIAISEINLNGQNYADSVGTCTWGNDYISDDFYRSDCPSPYFPEPYPVVVPDSTFTSNISKSDANQKALNFAQTQADSLGVCNSVNLTLTAQNNTGYAGWVIQLTNTYTGAVYTYNINSASTAVGPIPNGIYNIYVYNTSYYLPNSIFTVSCNYNYSGPDAHCYNIPISTCNYLVVIGTSVTTYYSVDKSGNYYSQNCPSGTTASPYYVSIPAGTFASNVSQADADQQAINYGQSQANQYGACPSNLLYLYLQNNTQSYDYVVELTDVYTNAYYQIPVTWGGTTLPGPIPASRYNVRIYNSLYNAGATIYYCGSYMGSGNDFTFYNVDILTNLFQIKIFN